MSFSSVVALWDPKAKKYLDVAMSEIFVPVLLTCIPARSITGKKSRFSTLDPTHEMESEMHFSSISLFLLQLLQHTQGLHDGRLMGECHGSYCGQYGSKSAQRASYDLQRVFRLEVAMWRCSTGFLVRGGEAWGDICFTLQIKSFLKYDAGNQQWISIRKG